MPQLSDIGYEILQDAVNLARDIPCRSVRALKIHLEMRWPGRDIEISEAIIFWAADIRSRYPAGVPA